MLLVVTALLLNAAPPPNRAGAAGKAELISAKLEALARDARSKDRAVRERAVGALLSHLWRGMTLEEVEDLLGPPDTKLDTEKQEGDLSSVIYYCRPPWADKTEMWVLYYNVKEKPYYFVRARRDSLFNEDPGLPSRPDPPDGKPRHRSARVEGLSRHAKGKDRAVRERAVGALLSHLWRGMTLEEVEDLLGPPDTKLDTKWPGRGRGSVTYLCRPPEADKTEQWVLIYRVKEKPYRFVLAKLDTRINVDQDAKRSDNKEEGAVRNCEHGSEPEGK